MEAGELRRAVEATIASVAPDADLAKLRPGEPLREQVELDSMDWLNVLAALHERFGIEIPETDGERLATIDSMVAYLRDRQPEPGARPGTAPSPGELESVTHRIRGTDVVVRPIRPDDLPLEADFVRHLSSETRYDRFMVTLRELSPAKLKYLTDVDQVGHVALVATAERDGRPVEVGVVRYIVEPGGSRCEFAIAIDDAWRGSGLAGILMRALTDIARSRGIATMEGIVLATNNRMLRFTRQLGFRQERDPDDPTTFRVAKSLR